LGTRTCCRSGEQGQSAIKFIGKYVSLGQSVDGVRILLPGGLLQLECLLQIVCTFGVLFQIQLRKPRYLPGLRIVGKLRRNVFRFFRCRGKLFLLQQLIGMSRVAGTHGVYDRLHWLHNNQRPGRIVPRSRTRFGFRAQQRFFRGLRRRLRFNPTWPAGLRDYDSTQKSGRQAKGKDSVKVSINHR
jgi:hypothetical protein